MMKRALIALWLWVAPMAALADDLVVFAAASLKGPLDIIAAGQDVRISYGGSGALARQVGQGAPADIVLLAHTDWMDTLVTQGAVDAQSVAPFLANTLVIVGQPAQAPIDLTPEAIIAGLDGGRLAMGFTRAVPAGIYGREAFETLGLWDALAVHVAETDNVRAALALVARGEAPMGVVYQSDVLIAPELSVVARIPASSHAQIRYFGAVTAQSDHPDAAAFLSNLASPEVQEIFGAAGFCIDTRWC